MWRTIRLRRACSRANLAALPSAGRTLAVCGILADKDAAGRRRASLRDCIDAWWFASTEGARGTERRGIGRRESRRICGAPLRTRRASVPAARRRCAAARDRRSDRGLRVLPHRRPRDWIGSRRTACCRRERLPEYTAPPAHHEQSKAMMDRRVKERLIGATILVALIVLIVPELLVRSETPASPPLAAGVAHQPPTRSVSVDLGDQQGDRSSADAPCGFARLRPPLRRIGAGRSRQSTHAAAADGAEASATQCRARGRPMRRDGSGERTHASTTLRAQNGAGPALETARFAPQIAQQRRSVRRCAEEACRSASTARGRCSSAALPAANAEKLVHQLKARGVVGLRHARAARGHRCGTACEWARCGSRRRRACVAKLKAQGHPATIVTPAS